MTITKQGWQAIEEQLKGFWGNVELELEGRKITLHKRMVSENRLAILVYIDGAIQPAKGFPSSELFDPWVKQIWREHSRAFYTPKCRERLIKSFGKRKAKHYFPKLDERSYCWMADFRTIGSLIRKYKKLPGLQLLSIGGKPPAPEYICTQAQEITPQRRRA